MNRETLRNTIFKFAEHWKSGGVKFIWHGGEPLLAGLSFFEDVVRLQKEVASESLVFKNHIQTNGVLLSQRYLDFFDRNDFHVGISIDGPETITDDQRRHLTGKGVYNRVFGTIKRIQGKRKAGNNINTVAVLTKKSVCQLGDFYDFFKDNSLNVRISPILPSKNTSPDLMLDPVQYGRAMIELFDK